MNFFEYIAEDYPMDVPNEEHGLTFVRANQPQIDDISQLVADLVANKVSYGYVNKTPSDLIPTQGEFNDDKVTAILSKLGTGEVLPPVIVSNDDYIIDGHHRWLGCHEADVPCRCLLVDMNLEDMHGFLKDKPYVTCRTLNESMLYEPIDDEDFLKEASYKKKPVKLYKPIKTRRGDGYTFMLKNKKGIVKKVTMFVPSSNKHFSLNEGAYIDNIRRQLVDLLRLRLNIADLPNEVYSDILQREIDKIMSLDHARVMALYNTQVVNNNIHDLRELNESIIPDIHREISLANTPEDIVKTYRKFFRHNPNSRYIGLLTGKTTTGMFKELANSEHHQDAYIAAKHGDHTVRDVLKTHPVMAVRFEAAKSPNTHTDLADDDEAAVRYNVAKHAVDHRVLRKLAGDANLHVAQMALARSKEIGNSKHVEVLTKFRMNHQNQAEHEMSHLTSKFEDDVNDSLNPPTVGIHSHLLNTLKRKFYSVDR